jgi:hypothetical protein
VIVLNLKVLLEAGVGVLEGEGNAVKDAYAPQTDELQDGDGDDFVGDGVYDTHQDTQQQQQEDFEKYGNHVVQVDQDYGDIDADEEI